TKPHGFGQTGRGAAQRCGRASEGILDAEAAGAAVTVFGALLGQEALRLDGHPGAALWPELLAASTEQRCL
ncbi:unnamed protein product, partial [Effrenium voratum]